ncbi:MAG TPA: MFS transporter, partial [Chloroflexota bacterium]
MRFGGLWRHPDFVKLWTGHTISRFGSEISNLAIPLTAALVLNASAFQMGLLGTFEFAPFLLLSLFAGVWVDRVRRLPILIVADVGRFVLLGSIPVAAFFGVLRIEQLFVVGLLTGVLTVFFDVADQSYLPVLVSREHLVEGNRKLEMSRSVAAIVGPGTAGALVQLVTAPIAVAVDAVSFLASAICLLFIHAPEPQPEPQPEHHADRPGSIWAELREGLAVVLGNPLLRSIAGCTGTANLFQNAMMTVYVLYLTRDLDLGPAVVGIIFAVGGPGALLGALVAGRIAQRFGLGATIIGSSTVAALATLLVPLASGPTPVVI